MNVIELSELTLWRRTQEEFSRDFKRLIFDVLEGKYRRAPRRQILNAITLSIPAGEKVAIIGPNGSGKSTLLKVICGILSPTRGRVRVEGKIAPLIELGAGFDPNQNLVDNVIYYGVLLGFARDDVKKRVDAILDFAELTQHAREPFKAMSSGMAARLGFAIATDVQPEILILDEVLSVGDESFKRKSLERIQRFWTDNCTIVIVSHDLTFVASQCQRAIWIDQGTIIDDGPAAEVVQRYRASVN